MTTFSGTLNISPRGAQLQCHLGSFILRDERLTNLGSGKHRGFFEVQKIMPHAINRHGQLQLVLLAVIKQFALGTSTAMVKKTDLTMEAKQQQLSWFDETDSLDESISTTVTYTETLALPAPVLADDADREKIEDAVTREVIQSNTSVPDNAKSDLPLTVALDPTLTREKLRREVKHLQACGYSFDLQKQVWQLAV